MRGAAAAAPPAITCSSQARRARSGAEGPKGSRRCSVLEWRRVKRSSVLVYILPGPVLGAFMYDAGGFFLPFAVTGTAILLSGVVVLVVTEVA